MKLISPLIFLILCASCAQKYENMNVDQQLIWLIENDEKYIEGEGFILNWEYKCHNEKALNEIVNKLNKTSYKVNKVWLTHEEPPSWRLDTVEDHVPLKIDAVKMQIQFLNKYISTRGCEGPFHSGGMLQDLTRRLM